MLTVNIHDAKTQLSKLVAMAAKGKPFIIAKAGKPLVKVLALDETETEAPQKRRFGSMRGKLKVPDNFDTLGQAEIKAMFNNSKL
jgi:prevent-host-death family protein